ncbi:chitinase [Perkinsus olseni]|uniref:Chitinase n=1 Tax=Perkinsus olseni TaxID=32597 RepID=A0A7J6T557_PEROL|nr:chitinase [Perkinsus olseni]
MVSAWARLAVVSLPFRADGNEYTSELFSDGAIGESREVVLEEVVQLRNTADAMGEIAEERTVVAVLSSRRAAGGSAGMHPGTGDNFYEEGIPTDEFDPRFHDTFENVFSAPSLRQVPWYVIAGNHDHIGNVTAQIAYSKMSSRWVFPALFHHKLFRMGGSSVLVVMIDTIVLDGVAKENPSFNCRDQEGICMSEYDEDDGELSDTQQSALQWIDSALSQHNTTADFILVVGHYPIWSLAEHGPTYRLSRLLMPLLTKYRVTAYLSGHDHVHQHLDLSVQFDISLGAVHKHIDFFYTGGDTVHFLQKTLEGMKGGQVSIFSALEPLPDASQDNRGSSAFVALCSAGEKVNPFRVFGYLPEYRLSDDIDFDGIFSSGVTDLIFFSVEVGYLGIIEQKQRLPSPTILEKARAAADAHGGRLMVSIGGAGRSQGFADMVAHNGDVRRFLSQLDDMFNKYQLDGVDFNWEYPQSETEWNNFKQMLRWVKFKLRKRSQPATITLAYHPDGVQEEMIRKYRFSKQCDYFLAMTYEHPEGGGVDSTRAAVGAWRQRGLDERKLALGVSSDASLVVTSALRGDRQTGEPRTYAEISAVSNPHQQFIYDSPEEVEARTRYAKDEGLGGVMIWELGQDLPPSNGSSLLSAISRVVSPSSATPGPEKASDEAERTEYKKEEEL